MLLLCGGGCLFACQGRGQQGGLLQMQFQSQTEDIVRDVDWLQRSKIKRLKDEAWQYMLVQLLGNGAVLSAILAWLVAWLRRRAAGA